MKTTLLRTLIASVGCLLIPFAVGAAVIPANSSITAVFKQLGVPVEAKFTGFTAQIDYDPANVAQAKAQLQVDVASFDLGDPEYNKEVLKKEWFNAAQFPKATFTTSAIKTLAPGKLLATGKLSVKGRVLDVDVPIAVREEGGAQIFEGALPIKRLYFNIGEGDWKDTDTVADEVIIKFKLVKQ